MSVLRGIKKVIKYDPALEGAGVKVRRAFGFSYISQFDPFLLLDEFRSKKAEDYLLGFPWHPHRGIETVTYLLEGTIAREDSLGNKGFIDKGCVQWMTAGAGIIHREMPLKKDEGIWGFQLWVNLPQKHKMSKPAYRDIGPGDIPIITDKSGVRIKIIAGCYGDARGPVRDIVTDPRYLDISVPPNTCFKCKVPPGRNAFAYVYSGAAIFINGDDQHIVASGHTALFLNGNSIMLEGGGAGAGFLLISGVPIREPIAWSGPIVMNDDMELRQAFKEYEDGTFLHY